MIRTKKITALLLAGLMVTSLCACGKSEDPASESESVSMPNPFTEAASSEEMCTATGMSIEAPEGASDITYSYCTNSDDSIAFAQVSFTYEGKSYNYRCAPSGDMTELVAAGEETNILPALSDCTNAGAALAGIYCEWKNGGVADVNNRTAVFAFNPGEEGFIAWLDVVPGFLYSLSVDDGADQDTLMEMAEEIFVPMQSEA